MATAKLFTPFLTSWSQAFDISGRRAGGFRRNGWDKSAEVWPKPVFFANQRASTHKGESMKTIIWAAFNQQPDHPLLPINSEILLCDSERFFSLSSWLL